MSPSDDEKYNACAEETASQVVILASRAREGNTAAFGQLVDLFHKDIFRMVYYRARDPMDAEDITQEIFMSAFKNLTKLKNAGLFRSWLFSIGINKIRDFYRKKKVRSIFGDPAGHAGLDTFDNSGTETDDSPDAFDTLMKQEFWRHMDLLLDKLSRAEREVFLLKFMDHLTIKEVSQVLKKSESAVKTHLYRALTKFRADAKLIRFFREDLP